MEITPRLVLRAVKLSATTPDGEVGRTISFTKGLNVLRAGNTSGKSTTLQAIIYALGLEGMLSPRREVPLPHSMTDRVSVDGVDQVVLQSYVALEFENAEGTVVTAARWVKHPEIKNTVISIEHGAALTQGGSYAVEDFFVRLSGSAQRERGFHHFLSGFLGWNLPFVTHMDGSERPLYSECLFPFFYVEQKHGWSGVQARIPTYLGIREVGKRSFEFVLGLEVFQRILERQRITSNIAELEASWRRTLTELKTSATTLGSTLSNEPRRIVDSLADDSAIPTAFAGGAWLPLDLAIDQLRANIVRTESRTARTVEEDSSALEAELEQAEDSVRLAVISLSLLMEERNELQDQARQLDLRLEALTEDLQRHKDSALLVRLGAKHAKALTVDHTCPTCHQEVTDGMDISAHAMTVDENIAFIERQRSTFSAAREDIGRTLDALVVRERSVRDSLGRLRHKVRRMKNSLLGPGDAPSITDVSERAALQEQLDRLLDNRRNLDSPRETLRNLAESHKAQSAALKALATSALSDSDQVKLRTVEMYLRQQLKRYHFDSLKPEDVEISRDTYRPAHEGYELGFDLSASDMIRVIWSYLFAVMRVSEEQNGNHLGLLIFDEPKQQETASKSYAELLQEASEQGNRGSQIIFATSESNATLLAMLNHAKYNLIDIPDGEKILTSL
ncbi:AAA family ATPase [Pseudarthrobacter sp. NPDC058196]|uniref:AAA family ATPase n=1 Tax=Pseudarthrobacter sp. NPDC058196 TaxID=3346376 RepID=UPI0036DE203D